MAAPDLIVVGAGPGGIAAATQADALGLRVTLVDEQPAAGGQIYRALAGNSPPPPGARDILGAEYWSGGPLLDALAASGVEHIAGATVWTVEKAPLAVGYVTSERAFLRGARAVILATGAYERPVPVPGWTLPGVMTAGAVQILMKTQGSVPAGRVVLAGCGPLLLLVAGQLLDAGVDIAGFLDTSTAADRRAALAHLPRALGAPGLLAKGLRMTRRVARAGIPTFREVTQLRCLGDERATGVRFAAGGRAHQIDADLVLLHEGVVPNVQITRQLDLEHAWHETQRYWKPVLDAWGTSSDPRVLVAGDGGGIDGARAAQASGAIAALAVAARLGAVSAAERDRRAAPHFARRSREARIRPLLDQLYRPRDEITAPPDLSTIVCRCEEVDVAEVADCVRTGCHGPNQLKSYSRCGMGPCQGRMCGLTAAELIARERGVPVAEVGYFRIRAPLKPIELGALAAMEVDVDAAEPGVAGAGAGAAAGAAAGASTGAGAAGL